MKHGWGRSESWEERRSEVVVGKISEGLGSQSKDFGIHPRCDREPLKVLYGTCKGSFILAMS